jgi:hypothetical protein
LNFTGINGYTVTGDSVTQKFNGIQTKLAFGEFGVQVVVSQSLKNNMEMVRMIFRIFGINQNVINKDHYEFVEFLYEYRVHEIHEVCWCIDKTKRHDQIFIESISGGNGYFWNVTRPDLDLMISEAEVNLRKYLGSG